MLVDASEVVFGDAVTLIGGTGGQGGAGGSGGSGQSGFAAAGSTALGPQGEWCGQESIWGCDGGAGGRGGNGAGGGAGAGGDGGPSVLIARRAGGTVGGTPTFVAGTGGERPPNDDTGALAGPSANNRAY